MRGRGGAQPGNAEGSCAGGGGAWINKNHGGGSSIVAWKLSPHSRKSSRRGKRKKHGDKHHCNDEEYIGQPKVILTNVLMTKIGRKYTQVQPKSGANLSDAGKLQSDQPPSSSVASLKIWQFLNPTLQSLFLPKRQPQVVLTNVLRTKIGRKYTDSHVIIATNLSDDDKLQSGQLPSSSVASLQTSQILSSPPQSSFLSERSEQYQRKTDDDLCKLTKASKEPGNNAVTLRRRELQKKENKTCDEAEKTSRNMNSTSLRQKQSSSCDSEKRKRKSSSLISDDCNTQAPEKSLLPFKEQRLNSTQSSSCRIPCEDEKRHRFDIILVPDGVPQPLESGLKDTSNHNCLSPAYSCTKQPASETPPRALSEKQLSATSEDGISPRVSTIRKLDMDASQYLTKLRNRLCRGNRPLVSVDPIVLSSDDEDGSSEPQHSKLLQDNGTGSKETDQQPELCTSGKPQEDEMETHTEMILAESIEDKCHISSPSGSTPRKQMKPTLDVKFDSLYIGKFKWLSTDPARFTTKCITIPFQVALNKKIQLAVDTLDLRRLGLWRTDGGCSSTMIIFLWLSVDYVERIETQLGKSFISKPSKPSEFVFLELSQLLTESEEDRLTELITVVSKKNRAPDLPEFMSLKEAIPLLKDLSPEESSFVRYSKDLLKQYMPKRNTSDTPEPAVQGSKPKVSRPSYALANKQNSGCYSISLSSPLNEEWKEVKEIGTVKNLIVYPPPPAKGGLGVTREDLECLEYGEFLNDVIIDFYLKYLLLEKAPKQLADRTHIFSSFFYKCLTRTEKNSEGDLKVSVAQRRHRRVRTWTRHINIFNKDYIFVPVNEESHWYIAVICFPWLEEAVYEDCPSGDSLNQQPQQSSLQAKKENTRTGSVLVFPGSCRNKEDMDANRSLFSKGGSEIAAFASVLDSDISEVSLGNSKRQLCKRPCILILDSLKAGSVQKTAQILREYLEVEWEAKRKTHREFSKSTMIDLCPTVPKQDNSSDCGVYLLQYVESFLQNPIVNFEQPLHLEKWFPRQLIRSKREEIRDLILQLHFQQHSGSSS
ncbi:sentrin-specific protease 7 isoform X1 [Melanerpes formicivorus]|uniref:sentrin-specific protease 7 isoform X1 n=1 Tax=Melanerpes formicivorus TaxID=211600 RepID=UPI0035902D59